MSTFDALTFALEDWFNTSLSDLPDSASRRVEQEFFPMPWDSLSAEQRRSVALQLDYQHDPATEQDQKFWWDFFERVDTLQKQVAEWEAVATPTAADLALKETRLIELKQELGRMDAQKRMARGDYFPVQKSSQNTAGTPLVAPALLARFIAYPKAIHQLTARLNATPEELAAWIWSGPKEGGIAAYLNANELDPPPRFLYTVGSEDQDYIAPLMGCWFKEEEIDQFVPVIRYITGKALIDRWGKRPALHAVAFIQAKITESRLSDIHPIYGGTRGTFAEYADWPPLESGLFSLSEVEQIEFEDFGQVHGADSANSPEIGSPVWRKQNARTAANALHDQPGGSRDKKRQICEIWATGKYTSRDLCAEQECAALNMSISVARRALHNTPTPSRC